MNFTESLARKQYINDHLQLISKELIMKLTMITIFKISLMLAVTIFVFIEFLMSPTEATGIFDFAGQTTGSGRIWWWF